MLGVLIAPHFDTSHILASFAPDTVHQMSGERDVVPVAVVTITDWLSVFVRTEATNPQAHVVTRQALDGIAWKPDQPARAVAARLTNLLPAAIVDPNRRHASEMRLSWWYIPQEEVGNLM